MDGSAGTLWVVATPIGNLGDLSPRAVQVLAAADVIAAEDTRRTGNLLVHAGIDGPRIVSFFEGNEAKRTAELVERLRSGASVALVTDAGTPGVSDPGERLVRACIAAEIAVEVVPGPSAVLAALVVSGLAAGRFVFEGFLPRTGGKRAERLAELATESRTVVFFESPRRTAATLSDLGGAFGAARPAAICRELTKLHEEVLRGTLGELIERVAERGELKGEVVIVVAGTDEAPPSSPQEEEEHLGRAVADAQRLVADGARPRDAAKQVASAAGVSANAIYREMTAEP